MLSYEFTGFFSEVDGDGYKVDSTTPTQFLTKIKAI